jgi:hypothetical protein
MVRRVISSATPLTPFQIEVSSAFFDLPESRGFLLAGGAALVAQHLINRPTRDLDFFTSRTDAVPAAADAFRALAGGRRWQVAMIREAPSFVRMHVHHGADEVLVDLVGRCCPWTPGQHDDGRTDLGPSRARRAQAHRPVRPGEARDFADGHGRRSTRWSPWGAGVKASTPLS